MSGENSFKYSKSQHLDTVTLLEAQMHDFCYHKHSHEAYSFGITLAGRQDFFAAGAFHNSHPGNIIVFNPGQIHDGHSGEDSELHYRMLYVQPAQFECLLATAGIKRSRDFQITDTLLEDPLLRQYLLRVSDLVEHQQGSRLQLECELYQVAERVARRYGHDADNHKAAKVDTLLLRARDYIHDNITADMSLDEISRRANLSKYHFLRLFRRSFGATPHQYILNYRLNRVREELESGLPIDDAVHSYGFGDLSHLNRRFKPVYGMTPKQYQRHFLSS